jgi:hypothetical protein
VHHRSINFFFAASSSPLEITSMKIDGGGGMQQLSEMSEVKHSIFDRPLILPLLVSFTADSKMETAREQLKCFNGRNKGISWAGTDWVGQFVEGFPPAVSVVDLWLCFMSLLHCFYSPARRQAKQADQAGVPSTHVASINVSFEQ